ncbi:MAG: aminotransferase class I/II-fold pyridoxal phosphate-dependent enzyme [Betaproteobacteria bacterium]|nr:aminotransferase class I/II-fold pyridoxal phosphate-dependent enzyme [Betaproteobacteria bacterium]
MLPIRPEILNLRDSPIVEVWRLGFEVPDVIGLWAGELDVPTPRFICDAAHAAMCAGKTFYTHKRGIPELRAALLRYYKRLWNLDIPDQSIAVTSSGMNAVMLICETLLSSGDNAVFVTPSWPNIERAAEVQGCEIREAPMQSSAAGWSLDLSRVFAHCDERTRFIYYASPGNPTGAMIPPAQQRELLEFARERGIFLVADEVYHRFVYDRAVAPSILEIARPGDPVFVVNSFSKAWAMTGWRMGWMIYPQDLAMTFEKLIEYNTSGGQAFLQEGAIAALEQGEPFVSEIIERSRQGRSLVVERLSRMPGVRVTPAAAAFYVMFEVEGVNDTLAFCKRLVTEARVGLSPGSAFGAGAERHIRLCYAKTGENLTRAMDRLEVFLGAAGRAGA